MSLRVKVIGMSTDQGIRPHIDALVNKVTEAGLEIAKDPKVLPPKIIFSGEHSECELLNFKFDEALKRTWKNPIEDGPIPPLNLVSTSHWAISFLASRGVWCLVRR